jgi:hypothetical protein
VTDDAAPVVDPEVADWGRKLVGDEIWLTIDSSCCMRLRASVSPAGITASGGVLMHS